MRKWKSTLIVSPKPESNLNMAGTLQLHWVRRQVCIAKRGLTENVSEKRVCVLTLAEPHPRLGTRLPVVWLGWWRGRSEAAPQTRTGWGTEALTDIYAACVHLDHIHHAGGREVLNWIESELKVCVCSAGYILLSGDKMTLNVPRKTAKTWQNLESMKY